MALHPFISTLDFCKLPLARWRDFLTSGSRCKPAQQRPSRLGRRTLHVGRREKVVAGSDDKDAEGGRERENQAARMKNSFASSPTKVARGE
jgi:hypothetical protein